MTNDTKILYWLNTAEQDLKTAEKLFQSEDYHWCLFIGHLVIEKIIKAVFTQNVSDTPPRIHDLVKLSKLAGIHLSDEQLMMYNRINDFNIEARYPDQKLSFYKISTKEFAENNLELIKKEFLWLKSLLK